MSTQPEEPKKKAKGVSGLAIPAGILIGLGIGLAVDNTAAGILIGLGCGFLGMIVIRLIVGDW